MNILMTGCGSGFGAYVRERLLEQGHNVYGVGLEGPDMRMGFATHPHVLQAKAHDCVYLAAEKYGTLDVLINNAGTTHCAFMPDHDMVEFERVMSVNTYAVLAFTQAFIKHHMKSQWMGLRNYARIINTGSMCIRQALRSSVGYVASKAALHAITCTTAKEAAGKYPLMAMTISPSSVENTTMVEYAKQQLIAQRGMTREQAEAYSHSASPLGRAMTHDEVWKAYDYAVNHAPMYASGSNLELPGGTGQF
jgi:NAD(P)-dependent dehydrogenase (short-subunit alcohol dehydrogenase family)